MRSVYNGRWFELLNRTVTESVIEKVTFTQRFEGGEDAILEKTFLADWTACLAYQKIVRSPVWQKKSEQRGVDKKRGSLGKREHGGPQKSCVRTSFNLNSGWTSLSFTSQHKNMRGQNITGLTNAIDQMPHMMAKHWGIRKKSSSLHRIQVKRLVSRPTYYWSCLRCLVLDKFLSSDS